MKSIYEQIMSQFNKQILVPFVAVIVVTLVALLLINEHQSHINKIALVTGTQENLVNLATSTSIQISDKFNHEKQSMELLQTLLKHNFKYPNKFKAKKNQFKSNLGLYSYKNKKFSLYTSNKKVLNQKALKYLGILVFTSPYIMKIVNISEYFISSARINIDFKYILTIQRKQKWPKILI